MEPLQNSPNEISEETPGTSTSTGLASAVIIISWLIYLPIAFMTLAVSTDGPGGSWNKMLFGFVLNGIPFITLLGVTYVAIKRQSWKIALTIIPSVAASLIFVFALYIGVGMFVSRDVRQAQNSCPTGTYLDYDVWSTNKTTVCIPQKVLKNCPDGSIPSAWVGDEPQCYSGNDNYDPQAN